MRDVGRAHQRTSSSRFIENKQYPTFPVNNPQIVEPPHIFQSHILPINMQWRQGMAKSSQISNDIEAQKQDRMDYISNEDNANNQMALKKQNNVNERGARYFQQKHVSEPISNQLSVIETLMVIQKSRDFNLAIKDLILQSENEEQTKLKLIKVTPKLAKYQNMDCNVQDLNGKRGSMLKYLNNSQRSWMSQMPDSQIQNLYKDIAKELDYNKKKQHKFKQWNKVKQIQRRNKKRLKEPKQRKQWENRKKVNEYLKRTEKQPVAPRKTIQSMSNQYRIYHDRSLKAQVIVLDQNQQECQTNNKPCNSWLFKQSITKMKKKISKKERVSISQSQVIQQRQLSKPRIVSYNQYEDFSYVSDKSSSACGNKKVKRLAADRQLQISLPNQQLKTQITKDLKNTQKNQNENN